MKLFDAHCHLQMPQFDVDRGNVIARMNEKEMGAIVVGTDYEMSKAGLELAKQYDFLWASVGLHPNDNESESFDFDKYEELARDPKVVAIGECGLDYFRSGGEGQREKFAAQVELALKVEKPLIIHCRGKEGSDFRISGAHYDLQQMLQKYAGRLEERRIGVVVHFFTGTEELAGRYLELGCYLSFPGPVTYTDMYDESIRATPLDRLLIETDSPFAAPAPYRGKRNEPAYVAEVAKKLAQIKVISAERVAVAAVENAGRVFKLPS